MLFVFNNQVFLDMGLHVWALKLEGAKKSDSIIFIIGQ